MKHTIRSALAVSAALAVCILSSPAGAVTKDTEQCLACHGPYDALVKKDVRTPADPGPINPHVYVPHQGGKEYFDCLICHSRHEVPPPKGWKDETVTLDACSGCHHTQTYEKCAKCHDQKPAR